MTGNGEILRSASQPAGMQAGQSAGDSARRAWSKPVVQRFPLQRTLAGSSFFPDPPSFGAIPT